MNAESRNTALSASVLLKELVSRNFRALLYAAPWDHSWFEATSQGLPHKATVVIPGS